MERGKALYLCSMSVLLVVLSILIYGGTTGHGYTWDDNMLLYEARGAQDISDWRIALTTDTDRLYRPLRTLSYALENTITSGSPAIRHGVNIFLYAIGCVVFLFMAMIIFRDNMAAAAVAAIIYTVHPVHGEIVASVANRGELLCAIFMLGSIALAAGKRTVSSVFVSLILFVLAMMSKESAIVIPGIIFFVVWLRDSRDGRTFPQIFLSAAGYAVLYLVPVVVFMMYRGRVLSETAGQLTQFHGGSYSATLLSAMSVVPDYAAMLVAPVRQCAVYDVSILQGFTSGVAGGVAILVLCGVVSLAFIKKNPFISTCLMWMVLCWVPASNIIPIATLKAGRLMFMSSAGASLLIGAICVEAAKKAGSKNAGINISVILAIIVVLLSVIFAMSARQYAMVWKSNYTLWSDSVECSPGSATAWNNFGNALVANGKYSSETEWAFLESIRLKPVNPQPYLNLGNFYGLTGKYEKALEMLLKYNAMEPGDREAGCLIAVCVKRLGRQDEAQRWNDFCGNERQEENAIRTIK